MDLATRIGANPSKFMGTRTNISFLGKGPTKNPLFQSPIAGLENASRSRAPGKPERVRSSAALKMRMGFAISRANLIQYSNPEILGH